MSRVEVRDFSVRRGEFSLGPMSFHVEKGESFAILGSTGAGKTVLLEALGGMFPGNGGSIRYDGRDIVEVLPEKRKLGFVYQDYALFPHMSVYENIVYGLKTHRFSAEEQERRAVELMEMLSITDIRNQYPGTLSGGERQRTALARALILEPEVLLLDEPFSALDPATKCQLYEEFLKIRSIYQCTIVFVTHDFTEAQMLADRIGIILKGQLKAVVPAKELLKRQYDEEVSAFLGRRRL